jgi:hypothetical protein
MEVHWSTHLNWQSKEYNKTQRNARKDKRNDYIENVKLQLHAFLPFAIMDITIDYIDERQWFFVTPLYKEKCYLNIEIDEVCDSSFFGVCRKTSLKKWTKAKWLTTFYSFSENQQKTTLHLCKNCSNFYGIHWYYISKQLIF